MGLVGCRANILPGKLCLICPSSPRTAALRLSGLSFTPHSGLTWASSLLSLQRKGVPAARRHPHPHPPTSVHLTLSVLDLWAGELDPAVEEDCSPEVPIKYKAG